jgi:hypothetical protein
MRIVSFLVSVLLSGAVVLALGTCALAAGEGIAARELAKEYQQVRQQRFYRHGSAVFDHVTRYAQMDESQMSVTDRFMRAFYEGRWDEIRTTLENLPELLADAIYDKMLDDLTGRNVPLLTLDDCLGLADACPTELTTGRVRKLGQLFRATVPKEQELWLKRALEKGSRRLGREESQRLGTGRLLLYADFAELARQYLPSAAEAGQIPDAEIRSEILNFLGSQEEQEESQQVKLGRLWKQKAKALTDPQAKASDKQKAAEALAELLGKAPAASLEPLVRSLIRDDPAAGLQLASAIGRNAQARGSDSDAAVRTNNLQAQKGLLLAAAEHVDLTKTPWNQMAAAMADWWVREAEWSFQQGHGAGKGHSGKAHVAPADLLETAPDGAWAKALPPSLRERVDMCLSKAVLASDRYEEAVELIVELAGRNPKAGASMAEEYLKAWAERHNPQIPEEVRKRLQLPEDARIVVTPIMMEKNIDQLAKMMDILRQHGIHPHHGELLVAAFDVCYSNAEVYRRSHIEKVFGPVDAMDEDIFDHMIRTMTRGLSSPWRKMDVQKESGTRRTQEEALGMVREGYRAAVDMIQQRSQKHPDGWRSLTLAGSLLSDWADFEYYQELAAETKAKRMEMFREKNNQAEQYFTRAARAYARQVPKLGRAGYTIDPYLAWFHSLLGINSRGDLNLSKPLDRRALGEIHTMIRALPGNAAQAHIDKLAKYVAARMEDTEHPLHEELKYKYLAGSLVITKDSPFSLQADSKVSYYDELLGEIRLETRVDGPTTVHRDQHFGIVLSVHHTEAIGRMADFGKYLVNETPAGGAQQQQPWAKKKTLLPTQTVRKAGDARGRRDELEMNIREALGLFFDLKSITFSPRDVQPRATERPGWKETVLAYVHAKAKDASVDKIPRIQMNLEFLDLTGPVRIAAESAETMLKVTDQPTPPRPFGRVDLTEVLDARNLAGTEEALLEITAAASGLVPDLDALVDLDALRAQLPVARIDPHEGTVVREINSWGDQVHAVSQRRWTVALDGSALVKPPRSIKLGLPPPKIADASAKYQSYADMDLVDLAEPTAVVGSGAVDNQERPQPALAWWIPYGVVGGGAAALLFVGLVIAVLVRGRGVHPLRARDVFHIPTRIDGFVVVQLLRALGASDLVRLSEIQRAQMRQESERIQQSCFAGNGSSLSEHELRAVAKKWLRIAL